MPEGSCDDLAYAEMQEMQPRSERDLGRTSVREGVDARLKRPGREQDQ
jgi:hypothetical protein